MRIECLQAAFAAIASAVSGREFPILLIKAAGRHRLPYSTSNDGKY